MKALILSAGQGTRLLPYTESVPKCLVPVCGIPILQYQISALAGRVDEVVLVTGYLHEQVRAFVENRCTIIRNEEFATTNSLYSLWLARESLSGSPFVLLNGDLVVDGGLVGQLIDDPAPTATLVDDTVELHDGEMNVVVRDGRVLEFSKSVPAAAADAQSLQITKFGADDGRLLFERAAGLVESGETGRFPAYAYDMILARSEMVPVYRRGGTWFEVDSVADLERCEEAMAAAGR